MTSNTVELLHHVRRLLQISAVVHPEDDNDDKDEENTERSNGDDDVLSSLKALLDCYEASTGHSVSQKGLCLLHDACEHQAAVQVIQYLVDRLPRSCLREPNDNGWIPLHCVLHQQRRQPQQQWPSLVIPLLVDADPASVLVRLPHQNSNDGDEDDDDSIGMLPSVMAHNHPDISARTVQYLLQVQLKLQEGLVLHHRDLAMLFWNEASYRDELCKAMFQVVNRNNNNNDNKHFCLKRICLYQCRLSSVALLRLQQAMLYMLQNSGSASCLEQFSLVQVHVWDANNNHRRHSTCGIILHTLLQTVLDHHGTTLQHFHWMLRGTVDHHGWSYLDLISHRLQAQQLTALQTLEYTTTTSRTSGRMIIPQYILDQLAKALRHPHTPLICLALPPHLSIEGANSLLNCLQDNATLQTLEIPIQENGMMEDSNEYVEGNDMIMAPSNSITLEDLRRKLVDMLRGSNKDNSHHSNTTLQTIRGHAYLVECPQVQLYLKLNREYHRRHVGYWSAALMPLVLAKVNARVSTSHNRQETTTSSSFGEDRLRQQQPKRDITTSSASALYYMLLARPDIIAKQQLQQL